MDVLTQRLLSRVRDCETCRPDVPAIGPQVPKRSGGVSPTCALTPLLVRPMAHADPMTDNEPGPKQLQRSGRCAVCGVRCAVCGVRCVVCGVRHAHAPSPCTIHHPHAPTPCTNTTHHAQGTPASTIPMHQHHPTCNMHPAECSDHAATSDNGSPRRPPQVQTKRWAPQDV